MLLALTELVWIHHNKWGEGEFLYETASYENYL